MPPENFNGLRVLSLESRRAEEMSKLISNNGGVPIVAPSVREVPRESNTEAIEFSRKLEQGSFDIVIFTTGVGLRLLTRVVEPLYSSAQFATLLNKVIVAARGPKPMAVLRQMGVSASLTAPEPNTWQDLIAEFDKRRNEIQLQGKRVAVQEYGVTNPELMAALKHRGAKVTSVPVYEWMLPEDTRPLQQAVDTLIRGEIDAVLFTSGVQIRHLFQVAEAMGKKEFLHQAMGRTTIASIGPLCSEEVRRYGLHVDMEPSHPKMGILVKEAAEKSGTLFRQITRPE